MLPGQPTTTMRLPRPRLWCPVSSELAACDSCKASVPARYQSAVHLAAHPSALRDTVDTPVWVS